MEMGTAHLPLLRLVLMGGKRVGKSSSGNTILGSNVFDSERGFEKCVQKQAEVLGRSIIVTDTPGWDELNAGDTPQRIRDEILDSVSQCDPGPHAFLLVVPVQDFLEEHRRAAEDMLTTLSPSVWRHTIVLLTWAAKFAPNSVEEFLEVQPHLKALVTKCGGRVHAVDNKNWTNKAQTAELLTKVDALIEANCGLYFSLDVNYMYSMLQDAKKELKRFEREAEEMKGALLDKSKELENVQHLHEYELAERDENFQAKLKEKDQSLEELQSDIEQMLKEKESEMEALKAQQEKLMTAMQSKVEDLEQCCLNLSEELATGQVQIEKLEEKLKEYEKTLEDKEKYLAEMRICQDNDAKHKTKLEDQIRNAEASLVEVRSEVQELKTTCYNLTVQCEEKEKAEKEARMQREDLLEKLLTKEQNFQQLQETFNSLKATLKQKDEDIKKLETTCSTRQHELREKEQLLAARGRHLELLKQNYSETLINSQKKLKDVMMDLRVTEQQMQTDESKLLLSKRRKSREGLHPEMSESAVSSRGSSSLVSELYSFKIIHTGD